MAKILGDMKEKLNTDMEAKFTKYSTHIKDLERVIGQNTKLIKDLTESIQQKNTEMTALFNEDKLK